MTMTASSSTIQIYWRQFLRQGEVAFKDFPADQTFANEHFVDFFGKIWLPAHPDALSLDSILQSFYDDSLKPGSSTVMQVFAVADGSIVESTKENEQWLTQEIRFVTFVAGNDTPKPAQPFGGNGWTLCIVGSSDPLSKEAFLQVASWNGDRFRYYGRQHVNQDRQQPGAWIYQGDSFDAFGEQSYLGPFNGHVNGSLVMKELHQPWIHWLAPATGFVNNMSNEILKEYDRYPYLSDGVSHSLSKVKDADTMETYIEAGITKWFNSRKLVDFTDEKKQPRLQVKNVKRWMAHLLLTTTINIISAISDTSSGRDNSFSFPPTHFYNADLFGSPATKAIQPTSDLHPLTFDPEPYSVAVDALKLGLVQTYPNSSRPQPDPKRHPDAGQVDVSDETDQMFIVEYGEGQNFRFTILEPSFEDIRGALTLLTTKPALLSKECIYAMLMVDPWNPIYSWKRGALMQYIPDTTQLPGPFNSAAVPPQKYDLEATIEAAVRDSPRYQNDADSPEREFIANLEEQRNGTSNFSDRMTEYLKNVGNRLNNADKNQVNAAMIDYMTLAESRRRIYRPVPLDEFDLTLPWASNYPHDKPLEMKSDGTIGPIAERGVKFLTEWISSLASQDPQMIPRPDKDDPKDEEVLGFMAMSKASLNVRTAAIGCQSAPAIHSIRRGQCPVMSNRRRTVQESS